MNMKLGELGDAIYAKDAEIAAVNATLKELGSQRRELENELLLKMRDAGTNIVRGEKATASIQEVVRPHIQDFDAFSVFVIRKKALHLFERRIASTAYREMKELLGNKAVPGLSEFTQTRLSVRKA